ncbi:MAG: DNA alkylation repair protein [Candidatus Fluviicola riflensis]|nr:MAG: DNA alkylation repair protein [Candidatus Fluviicola riflensis]OGS79254.1 MAG: DNA alkylation repair protein [Candidatus Fluviicola riflensis]OGS86686.1 MAG: DNA alkylation repair protein [Fluviicola sp. RIFCSPHIGHO2_01_FULL_43_53]OGS88840.1 MAG: DNA alkylation repair protein [Fluviicola sp. RIFCSPHIGHO2_12_FULL_43_24]
MTVDEVMTELAAYGSQSIKNILLKHGVKEPFFGVKIQDLKVIEKRVKKNHELALGLFNTGNADAMYLAGLIADDSRMTKADLQTWIERAVSSNISEYTVPWVCAASNFGFELGMEWINADQEHIATAGWNTLGGLTALKPDDELDLEAYRALIARIEKTIHTARNRERYAMNSFLIAVGSYVPALTNEAKAAGERIGVVTVDMNGTSCKVPGVVDYIGKVESKGKLGKKKKTLKC